MKPDDKWTVPLCNQHHQEGHLAGWKTFEEKYGVDLRAVAETYASISPHIANPWLASSRDLVVGNFL